MSSEQPKGPYLVFYRNLDSPGSFFYRDAQTFDEAVQHALSYGYFVNDWHNDIFIAEYVPLRILDGREVTQERFHRTIAKEYANLYVENVKLSDEHKALLERYEIETGNKWVWDEDDTSI